MPSKKPLNFEQSMTDLNELVEAMEHGEMPLEDSLKSFEKGIKLIRQCQTALTTAEQKVQILLKDNDTLQLEEFDAES